MQPEFTSLILQFAASKKGRGGRQKTPYAKRLDELEAKYDRQFASVFEAIRQLMTPPEQPPREMGFHTLQR